MTGSRIQPGRLLILGMGPGDPELLTVKAVRLLQSTRVFAYFTKPGGTGRARAIAASHMPETATELHLEFTYTIEIGHDDPLYVDTMMRCYNQAAEQIETHLKDGADVALLCEGDPLFYGSAMYVFDRLHPAYQTEIVPGITGMNGCWSSAKLPIAHGDDVLTVLPGTLPQADLEQRLMTTDAAIIMKLGTNFPKVRAALERAGLADRAVCVQHGTTAQEEIRALRDVAGSIPYFSMILVPGRQGRR